MIVHSRPLRVAALGMEQRTYNTLQLFFSDRCDNHYVLSDEKSADIFIIDMDGYQASKVLESHKKNHPHQPAIVISLKDNSAHEFVFVRKPIQLSALVSALSEAQKQIVPLSAESPSLKVAGGAQLSQNSPIAVNAPLAGAGVHSTLSQSPYSLSDTSERNESKTGVFNNIESTPPVAANDTVNKAGEPKVRYFVNTERLKAVQEESKRFLKTFQERPIPRKKTVKAKPISRSAMDFKPGVNDSGIRFIGDLNASFNPRNPSLISKLQYQAELTLQGYVSLAYKIALTSNSNVVVEGPWRPILILYKTKEICVEKDFRHLFALSAMTFKKEEVLIYGREQGDTATLSDKMVVQPIEQFLWKLALRTSQGRVPQGTDLDTPVKLIRWPNFTRYEVTPHALRIAALWAKHPTSLVDTAKILAIPQQYVFAFYCAAHATDMVIHVSAVQTREIPAVHIARSAHRNIFQNFLDRLRKL